MQAHVYALLLKADSKLSCRDSACVLKARCLALHLHTPPFCPLEVEACTAAPISCFEFSSDGEEQKSDLVTI